MTKFSLKVTQVFKCTRTIIVEREDTDLQNAIEEQQMADAPDFRDPGWEEEWEIQNEEVEAA